MSGGIARRVQRRSGLDAVCRARVRALRRPFVVRRARDRRRSRRSSSTSAPVCARTADGVRGRVPRHGAALAPALGSRAGPAVLHAAAPRGRDARRVRAAPGRGPARRGVRADDAAAVLPDRARPARRATCASTTPATTTSRSGSAKVRSRWVRHVGPTLGFRVDVERRCRSRTSPITVRAAIPSTPTTTSRSEMLELCDGVDLLIHDAQHTHGRVRGEAPLGSLHDRLRGARRARGGRAAARALPPRSRARRRRPRRDRAVPRSDYAARIGGPEVIAALRGPRDRARRPPCREPE